MVIKSSKVLIKKLDIPDDSDDSDYSYDSYFSNMRTLFAYNL